MNLFTFRNRGVLPPIVLVWLTVCLASLAGIAQKKSEREKDELKGAVKSVTVKEARLTKTDGKFIEETPVLNYIFSYDLKGNKTGADYYDNKTGVFLWKWRARFDASGKLTEFVTYEQNGSVSDKRIYTYNPANRKISEIFYKNNKPEYRTFYKYSRENRRVEKLTYNAEGKLAFKRVYDYDSSGNALREFESDYEGATSDSADKWVYRYDTKGNLETKLFYGTDGEENWENDNYGYMGKTVYVYDERENLIEKINYDSNNVIKNKENYDYKFDLKGNWTERTAYKKLFKDGKEIKEIYSKTYRTIIY